MWLARKMLVNVPGSCKSRCHDGKNNSRYGESHDEFDKSAEVDIIKRIERRRKMYGAAVGKGGMKKIRSGAA